jgi:hypothetical protein
LRYRSALVSAAVAAVTVMATTGLAISGGLTAAAGADTLAATAGCGSYIEEEAHR